MTSGNAASITRFVAFSAAFALALFPAFGVYESWRGRSKIALVGQVSLAWLTVQSCALVLMYHPAPQRLRVAAVVRLLDRHDRRPDDRLRGW